MSKIKPKTSKKTNSLTKELKMDERSEEQVRSASRIAFDSLRGPRPTSRCERDIVSWDYETERLWEYWQAGAEWREDNPYAD